MADPSVNKVIDFYRDIERKMLYWNILDDTVMALLPTRPFTLELVNLSIDEAMQNNGYGKKMIRYIGGYRK